MTCGNCAVHFLGYMTTVCPVPLLWITATKFSSNTKMLTCLQISEENIGSCVLSCSKGGDIVPSDPLTMLAHSVDQKFKLL